MPLHEKNVIVGLVEPDGLRYCLRYNRIIVLSGEYTLRKYGLIVFCLLIILITAFPCSAFSQDSSYAQTVNMELNGITREINLVKIDLKDPAYRVEAAVAEGQVGKVGSLAGIAMQLADDETEVIAAINGTFFNAYSDLQPAGNIFINGKHVYVSNSGTTIGFTADNELELAYLHTSIKGSVNGNWEYPYNWEVWGINQIYYRADANALYTPHFGSQVNAGSKTAIVVRNNKVADIRTGVSPIYSDGYTLVFGAKSYASMFKIGDTVDYKIQYSNIDFSAKDKKGAPREWSHIRTAIGAGPMLIKDGKLVLDAVKEGFTGKDFTSRAQRSFIGETADRILVIGIVPNATLYELADILMDMNLVNAMNLDGGSSSGLIYKGEVIKNTGSNISNAIVITRKKTKAVRLELNGRELFFDTDAFLENGIAMVPMRGIVESMGAEAGWDPLTGTLWARIGNTKIEMWNESSIVKVNGTYRVLPAPVLVRYNRTHIPAEFLAEIFGGTVTFDAARNMVALNLNYTDPDDIYEDAVNAYASGNIGKAVELFHQVLDIRPNHAGTLLKLARYYDKEGNNEKALEYYKKYLDIQPENYDVWHSLGWVYYKMNRLPEAKEVFAKLTNKVPNAATYWMALGDVYAHYQIQDDINARKCYENALKYSSDTTQISTIQSRINKLNN